MNNASLELHCPGMTLNDPMKCTTEQCTSHWKPSLYPFCAAK